MKKAIVVGASSGIGRELSYLLVHNGYRVGITGRRENLLQQMQGDYPESLIISSFDVSDNDGVGKLNQLLEQLGGLDLLVYCAGCGGENPDFDYETDKQIIFTNTLAYTKIADWALKVFLKLQAGHFVVISSISGLRGCRIAPAYHATKAYQIKYMEGVRQRINKLNMPIAITDVRPGFVDTDMANRNYIFWELSPRKAARRIFRAIKNKRNVTYISYRWQLIACLARMIPAFVFNRL